MNTKDKRLHSWPSVRVRQGQVTVAGAAHTPLRLTFFHNTVGYAVCVLWWTIIIILLIDTLMAYLEIGTLFNSLTFTRAQAFQVMAGAAVMGLIEKSLNYPLTRLFIGKRIVITINEKSLTVKCGFRKHTFERRPHSLLFVHIPFEGASLPAYRNARIICVIVAATRRVPIAQMMTAEHAEKFSSNANIALRLAESGRDIDPSKRTTN